MKKIKNALISVYKKDNLEELIRLLDNNGVKLFSTGGTQKYIESLGVSATAVEECSGYPSILGGRVKTLHPAVFGGILYRRDKKEDLAEIQKYDIPSIDLVVVDLYPFEETLAETDEEEKIIEKIDIGGISLIRAAAKNYKDVVVVSHASQYKEIQNLLEQNNCSTSLEDRKHFAAYAFHVSSHYDTLIFNHFDPLNKIDVFKNAYAPSRVLRYGENPHQQARFYGDFSLVFEQLNGKEISYNNIQDIDAAINLIDDFEDCSFAILKHTNPCGLASRENLLDAWKDALAGDPVSAFGGVLVCNRKLDYATAEEINTLFFEVLIAPEYDSKALELLKTKKNRIILLRKAHKRTNAQFKNALNGALVQDFDKKIVGEADFSYSTEKRPETKEVEDLIFANIIVKHSKSNAIVLAKNKQLLGSGMGQTSRIDALKQAITKAKSFDFELNGAVMASDAFFPFADSVELAAKEGITAVIQPGGSKRDQDSIDYCNKHKLSMVFTGIRHFKH